MDNHPGPQVQTIDSGEILFDRTAIRTMAKDIIILQETTTSEKKEAFLVNGKNETELKKVEFAPIEKKENQTISKQKERISSLINSLDSMLQKEGDDVLKNEINVSEDKEKENEVTVKTNQKEAAEKTLEILEKSLKEESVAEKIEAEIAPTPTIEEIKTEPVEEVKLPEEEKEAEIVLVPKTEEVKKTEEKIAPAPIIEEIKPEPVEEVEEVPAEKTAEEKIIDIEKEIAEVEKNKIEVEKVFFLSKKI